jgi:hypothetical protein
LSDLQAVQSARESGGCALVGALLGLIATETFTPGVARREPPNYVVKYRGATGVLLAGCQEFRAARLERGMGILRISAHPQPLVKPTAIEALTDISFAVRRVADASGMGRLFGAALSVLYGNHRGAYVRCRGVWRFDPAAPLEVEGCAVEGYRRRGESFEGYLDGMNPPHLQPTYQKLADFTRPPWYGDDPIGFHSVASAALECNRTSEAEAIKDCRVRLGLEWPIEDVRSVARLACAAEWRDALSRIDDGLLSGSLAIALNLDLDVVAAELASEFTAAGYQFDLWCSSYVFAPLAANPPPPTGRRRHAEAITERVRALREEGRSWKEVARVVNNEFPRPGNPWTSEAVRDLVKPRRQ